MDKTRLEAFSDGVIAVAITLLVIDLRVPEPTRDVSLAHRLGEQWPSLAAYVVSFLTIRSKENSTRASAWRSTQKRKE